MQVNLTYFKPNGTYYTSGDYITKLTDLQEIWDEVGIMFKLPGLRPGFTDFIILVEVPEHPDNHPKLLNIKNN
jgi:hypothetical protein